MKKIARNPKTAIVVGIVAVIVLAAVFAIVFNLYTVEKNRVATQQQWAYGNKENFDTAYKIAAADKDVPDKTLNIPNIVNCLGKTETEVLTILGNGAFVNARSEDGKSITIQFSKENSSADNISPTCICEVNGGKITKCSFSCNTSVLGYADLSFTDLINNAHIVENCLTEGGLGVEVGTVVAPTDPSTYTTFESDGTTTIAERYTFSGNHRQNGTKYKWTATVMFDYSKANAKGNLAKTIRTIEISVEL